MSTPKAEERNETTCKMMPAKRPGLLEFVHELFQKHAELRLAACVLGIYFFYFIYAVIQEHMERFRDYFFMLLIQCAANSLVAGVGMRLSGGGSESVKAAHYATISVSYLFAMWSSNAALGYVSYPTQVLAKSCKMVPVMLMGIVVLRRSYTLIEYVNVILITAGIALFQLGQSKAGTLAFQFGFGEFLLIVSLALDGLTGSLQERLLRGTGASTHQLMFHLNAWAMVVLLLVLAVTGEGVRALDFITRNPSVLPDMLLFGLASALGQNFVFFTLRQFGALTLATVTTTRKFFSILFSVVWFRHSLLLQQWVGMFVVFTGLGMEIVQKKLKHRGK